MLIGLCGKKQSGKSTITNYLCNKGWVEVSWAYPLKEIIGRDLFGLNDSQLYGSEAEKEATIPEWRMSARQILQVVGTDCFRNHIRDDFWVHLGKKRIAELQRRNPDINIVVSDCRFPNEMDAIEELGGRSIRVVKTGQTSVDNHPSETSLDRYNIDYQINARPGEIDKLKRFIDEIVEDIKKHSWRI